MQCQQIVRSLLVIGFLQLLPPKGDGAIQAQRAHEAQRSRFGVAVLLQQIAQGNAQCWKIFRFAVGGQDGKGFLPLLRVGFLDELFELAVNDGTDDAEVRSLGCFAFKEPSLRVCPQFPATAGCQNQRVGQIASFEAAVDGCLEVAYQQRVFHCFLCGFRHGSLGIGQRHVCNTVGCGIFLVLGGCLGNGIGMEAKMAQQLLPGVGFEDDLHESPYFGILRILALDRLRRAKVDRRRCRHLGLERFGDVDEIRLFHDRLATHDFVDGAARNHGSAESERCAAAWPKPLWWTTALRCQSEDGMRLDLAIQRARGSDAALYWRPLHVIPALLRGCQSACAEEFSAGRVAHILRCWCVVGHLGNRFESVEIPQDGSVVFAAGEKKVLIVRTPCHAENPLLMTRQRRKRHTCGCTKIPQFQDGISIISDGSEQVQSLTRIPRHV
mmetsp:Transcript_18148/g.51679  ORF Transcript_18148/g.51679 Transcript_18148/m.51679 type:complete len:440 (-) Transcript_18148:789-2108(-)